MQFIRVVLGWAIAVVTTVVVGSIVQTQFNLAAIAALGAPIGIGQRLQATAHDLLSFTPAYAILVAAAFALAWPVAGLLKRAFPAQRTLLFVLAGFGAVWVMIMIMNRALPVTPIGATRALAGTLSLAAAGALAGWWYARLTPMVRR